MDEGINSMVDTIHQLEAENEKLKFCLSNIIKYLPAVDWSEMRKQFFDECVDLYSASQYAPSVKKVSLAPHDLFEWFRKKLAVEVPCKKHKPKKLSYLAWHDWAEKKIKRGAKQKQCEKCGRWYFMSEF